MPREKRSTAPTAAPSGHASSRKPALRGIRDALGMPTVVLLGSMIAFGSLARESGLTLGMTIVSTAGMWALPAQIVFVELQTAGAEFAALILAVSLANARFLPMAISMLPLLRSGLTRPAWLYLHDHLISAQSWAYCRRVFPQLPASGRRPYFLGFALTILTISVCGTAIGFVLTEALPRPLALGLVLINPLFVLLLLADSRNRPVVLALIGGAVLGPVIHPVAPDWGLLATGLVAGTGGFVVDRLLRSRGKAS